MPARLVVRQGPRDLSLAVLEGFRAARGRRLLVMDADLSHPPESVPALLDALDQPETDFVIGSRYVAAGRTEAWAWSRQWQSRFATWLSKPLVGAIRDPMAGFFALRRDTFEQAVRLDPVGYKISLELLCRCPHRRVVEVPITFRDRAAGQSKMNLEQQGRYLAHLDRLYRDCRPGLARLVRPLLGVTRVGLLIARKIQSLVPGKR
jgi:dolichol-phosphate mannosyltransferase